MIASMSPSFSAYINTVKFSGKSENGAVAVSDVDVSHLRNADFDKSVMNSHIHMLDSALFEMTLSSSVVGDARSRIESSETFVRNLIDGNSRGIGQLIDSDMNAELAKMKALQTQEQLAIQALGIANSSSENVLRLEMAWFV